MHGVNVNKDISETTKCACCAVMQDTFTLLTYADIPIAGTSKGPWGLFKSSDSFLPRQLSMPHWSSKRGGGFSWTNAAS